MDNSSFAIKIPIQRRRITSLYITGTINRRQPRNTPPFSPDCLVWNQLTQPAPKGGENSVYQSNVALDFSLWIELIMLAMMGPTNIELCIPTSNESANSIVATLATILDLSETSIGEQLSNVHKTNFDLLEYLTNIANVAPNAVESFHQ
jgi:hypothetical protein